jgi:putative hemolysin
MTHLHEIGWWLLAIFSVLGCGLFSGIETGVYTINRIRLHVTAHSNAAAATLLRMIDNPNRLIATLLIGSSCVNYLASIALGAIIEETGYTGWTLVLIDAAVLTPILVIFGEVVPKDLFRSHTDRLLYPLIRPLSWLYNFLGWIGVLPLIDAVSRLLHSLLRSREEAVRLMSPRRLVGHLMREGVGHGVISQYQSDVIDRALHMSRLTVADVMEPWKTATFVRATQGAEAVWQIANRVPFSRVPLVDGAGKPVGILEVEAVLRRPADRCPPLATLARPVPKIAGGLSLRQALLTLQQARSSMGVVVDGERTLGLVTSKDLVEPLIGDLVAW